MKAPGQTGSGTRHKAAGGGWPASALRHLFGRMLPSLLALPVLLFLCLGPVLAETTPRAAAHGDFGRMVFDWSGAVAWSAKVLGNRLELRFDRPVAGDPHVLLDPLSHYVKGVVVSSDRRTLTFPLAVPVHLKTFMIGTSTVVDLSEADGQSAPVAHETKSSRAIDVKVRGAEHDGFNRIVFDWPVAVPYRVVTEGGQVRVSFDAAARIDPASLTGSLPQGVTVAETRAEGKTTLVVLALPAGMTVRHFTSGPKVALDLIPAPAKTAEIPAGPPPSAPPPPPPSAAPGGEPSAPAAPATPPPPQGEQAVLTVAFDRPAAAAVFQRGGWLWLVFDRKTEVDPKALETAANGIVADVQPVPLPSATALRMQVKAGFAPQARREGNRWSFDMAERPLEPANALPAKKEFDFADHGRVVFALSERTGKEIRIRDPEVGDVIHVMPVATAGSGVAPGRELPQAEILATAQGVAMVPRADGVRLESTRGGIDVSMPGGLILSRAPLSAPPPKPAPAQKPPVAQPGAAATHIPPQDVLDMARWGGAGGDYEAGYQRLLAALAAAPAALRNPIRLELARHYLRNGMDAETLGVLRVAAGADPALADTAAVRAMRGVADFMMGWDTEAIDDLSQPLLADDVRAQLVLAAARAREGTELASDVPVLRQAADVTRGWPQRLRLAVGRSAVEALARAGEGKAAAGIIEALDGPGLDDRDESVIAYLKGVAAEASQQYDEAIADYAQAEAGESRRERAYAARNRIELQLRLHKISAAEAIRQMQHLRFAWRGENFEYRLLKRLGEMLIADGQYGDGLRLLRSLVDNFPDNPDTPNVSRMMADAFARLYLDGAADALAPVAAIGLYDEFQDLTPPGEKGDEMIRKLADRLAAVDLLDRAGDLLRHQVQFRLNGVDKARVGARLAFLDLSDRKPGEALQVLDGSEVQGEPAGLYDQRRYLRVRALADLGRSAEALALIINDQADAANKLRAEIYWGMKKWPEAASALETVIGQPMPGKPLDPVTARRVLDLATALTLAKDEHGLQRIRRTYGPQMAATDVHQAFDLLTSAPEYGIVDYRRVPEKIKEVEDFQTFMSEWQKRVQSQGLSSLN